MSEPLTDDLTDTLTDHLTESQLHDITKSFISEFPPEYCQISSYNEFIETKIPFILKGYSIKASGHVIRFGNLSFTNPQYRELNETKRYICPREAARRNIPYVASLYIDIVHTNPLGIDAFYNRCHIADIPVMVRSKLCNLYDIKDPEELVRLGEDIECPGSYFILGGAPVVISNQMRSATNIPILFTKRKQHPKYSVYVEMRTLEMTGIQSSNITVGYMDNTRIFGCILPSKDNSINILYVICVLYFTCGDGIGTHTETSIYEYLLYYQSNFTDAEKDYMVHTFEAFDRLASRLGKSIKKLAIRDVLEDMYPVKIKDNTFEDIIKIVHSDILLQIGSYNKDVKFGYMSVENHILTCKKIEYLTILLKRLLRYLLYKSGRIVDLDVSDSQKEILLKEKVNPVILEDDRDSMVNQRVATVGVLLTQVFNTAFKKLCTDIVKNIDNINIKNHICPKIISLALRDALIQNRWTKNVHPGISQKFEAFNYISKLAEIRKITTSISAEGAKIDAPRNLHGSHYGRICPLETPEGKKCGLVKNMALGGIITLGSDPAIVKEIIGKMCQDIETCQNIDTCQKSFKKCHVYVNGDIIFNTYYPYKIVASLRDLRRSGGLNYEVSISYDELDNEIRVWCDYGRLITPALIIENGVPRLTREIFKSLCDTYSINKVWSRLVTRGYIEFIDSAEEENCVIYENTFSEFISLYDTDPKATKIYTHCHFDPILIFGVGVALVPFSDHNQAPRNTYQAGMAKQAEGIPGINYLYTLKGTTHVLNYPQIPLVYTRAYTLLGCEKQPAGINTYTAICPWKGFNQEDSIVMNKSAVDRGYMVNTTYIEFNVALTNNLDRFEIPGPQMNYRGDISKLDPIKCTVNIGHMVTKGDILIGLVQYIKVDSKTTNKRNASIIYDHHLEGRVHSINRGTNFEGYEQISIIVAQTRPPMVGDKFAAVHAQKGTISLLADECDLPFDEDGVSPTIFINPLALPSRMTIGMLAEMLTGTKIASSSKLHNIDVKDVKLEPILESTDSENEDDIDDAVKANIDVDTDNIIDLEQNQIGDKNIDNPFEYMVSRPKKVIDENIDKLLNTMHIEEFIKDAGDVSIDLPDTTRYSGNTSTSIGSSCIYSDTKQNRDASPFSTTFSISAICKELRSLGINQFGDKIMFHPHTGRSFKCLVFTGMTYYQKLKHMVVDKMHARARGRNTTLCNQPIEGGAVQGGFKFGYMEKDSVLASGASGFIHDRMFEQSDMNETHYCKRCGLQCSSPMCTSCAGETASTKIPFATKLFIQELKSMGIGVRVFPK